MAKVKIEDVEEVVSPKAKPVARQMTPPVIAKETSNYFKVEGFPSKMKFYPEGTEITARPLKVLEVKLLSALTDDNFNDVVNDVLSKTVKGINVNDLLVADKYYLIFWLRANTYKDSSYTMKFDCPHCRNHKDFDGSLSEYTFGLDCLNINHLNEALDLNEGIVLPISKNKITFRLPTVESEMKLNKFKESSSNSIKSMNGELLSVADTILSIDGEEMSLLQKYDFLAELFPGDYAYLESYVDSIDIGIAEEMDVVCNKCGGVSPVGVTFRQDFFLPAFDFTRHP